MKLNASKQLKEIPLLDFSKEQKEILFGGLLGDFNLQTLGKGKTWRLRLLQSYHHKEYLEHLYSIFSPWIKSPPKIYDKKINSLKNYKKISVNTITTKSLCFFGNHFYELERKNEKKTYPLHKKSCQVMKFYINI